MKLPPDLAGEDLAALLKRYGYEITRQQGSHLRLTLTLKGAVHHITVPRHKALRVGTLGSILSEVSDYLGVIKGRIADEIF